MNGLEEFYKKYPIRKMALNGDKSFAYRYYKNPDRKATIVLLTGGIGPSDLFSTCSHKMVNIVDRKARKNDIPVAKIHSAGACALKNILEQYCSAQDIMAE